MTTGRPLLILAAVLLGGFCLEDFTTFCHQQACPRYQLVNQTATFEERFYDATTWISTRIKSNSVVEINMAYQRLKNFCDDNGEAGHNMSSSWPRLVTSVEGDFFLQWFVPPGTALPAEVPSFIAVVMRPAAKYYIRTFNGLPSLESGQHNVQSLIEDLKQASKTWNPLESIGAGFDPVFSISHHNEIWIRAT